MKRLGVVEGGFLRRVDRDGREERGVVVANRTGVDCTTLRSNEWLVSVSESCGRRL